MYDRVPNHNVQEPDDPLIDRIRHDIQERLDQLLAEAEKLRRALIALGSRNGSEPARTARSKPAPTKAPRRQPSTTTSASPAAAASAEQPENVPAKRQSRTRSTKAPTSRAQTASGATKSAVLAALATGEAMTAGDVATATGLGRATVSTTLSKLSKTGEVTKAERGYRLAGASGPVT